MRRSYYRGLIGPSVMGPSVMGPSLMGFACLVLAGCAERHAPVMPVQTPAVLSTGRPVLGCREACLAEWQRAQPQAAQLEAAGRSRDLAGLVMRVGYQDDLSLYYLARAAEGLGYRTAAASYYKQSIELSGTSISCQHLSRQCGGVTLPRAATTRLAAIERMLNSPRPQRTGSAPQAPQAPETPETPEAVAAEVPEPAPPPASRPRPIPGGPAASEYIEPPPAVR